MGNSFAIPFLQKRCLPGMGEDSVLGVKQVRTMMKDTVM